ncbi:MAG TPA: RtcB family protein [Spirochaetota bacterium]|nr:RtcB family protein [Spirochaetota bacterium]
MKISNLKKINDYLYEIPADSAKNMKVPARIYGSENLILNMDDAVFRQISNVAALPGVVDAAICMPDGHSGYGFPIGGVAAIDPEKGIISPGGIGFDINCGVRLLTTNLTLDEVAPKIKTLVDHLFKGVPSGVGSDGILSLNNSNFEQAMIHGSEWGVKNGYGTETDLECCEESGKVTGADPSSVSKKARDRGAGQVGSLGSGNHYLEIQVVKSKNIFDKANADIFGITGNNQIVIMIHCGSRGFGHQVATDYLGSFAKLQDKFGYHLPDRELACAPFYSDEGQNYFRAMNCAVNIAFLNRQMIKHRVTEILFELFGSKQGLKVETVYDVCHNTAKIEKHTVNGTMKKLLVHRKGATRAFPPGSRDIPEKYSSSGQPVLIGGSMESGSYLLRGTESGKEAFYSTVHGSGRVMSRHEAKKKFNGREIQKSLESRGIYIRTSSCSGLAEEAGGAYKNVDEVVSSAENAGLGSIVAKLKPVGNIKG